MRVAIYVDSKERLIFYSRFYFASHEAVFFMVRYSLYLEGLKKGLLCRYVKYSDNNPVLENNKLLQCRDVLAGYLSVEDASYLYSSVYDCISKEKIDIFLIWNGSDVHDIAIIDYCKKNKIQLLFFEISNISGKLFVDSEGVNCVSSIFKDRGVKSEGLIDDSWYKYKENYLEKKRLQMSVPQAKKAKMINYRFVFDLWGTLVYGGVKFQSRSLLAKIYSIVERRLYYNDFSELSVPKKYYFLPMQVSTDSQVLLNSRIDNLGALDIAFEQANVAGVPLVIKNHPAEVSRKSIDQVLTAARDKGVLVSSGNTFDLISNAEKVITINSTAGFEALMAGVPVEFLGDSFYKYLNEELDLYTYVMKCLYSCDYFGNDDIHFDSILNHLNGLNNVEVTFT